MRERERARERAFWDRGNGGGYLAFPIGEKQKDSARTAVRRIE